MKEFLNNLIILIAICFVYFLAIMIVLSLSGCMTGNAKKIVTAPDGTITEVSAEYNRFGNQELSGVYVEYENLILSFDSQKSDVTEMMQKMFELGVKIGKSAVVPVP